MRPPVLLHVVSLHPAAARPREQLGERGRGVAGRQVGHLVVGLAVRLGLAVRRAAAAPRGVQAEAEGELGGRVDAGAGGPAAGGGHAAAGAAVVLRAAGGHVVHRAHALQLLVAALGLREVVISIPTLEIIE